MLLTTVAACSNDQTTTNNSEPATTEGQTASADLPDDVNDADVALVQEMIPHHEQSIERSEMVIANGADPTVIALAEQINNAQGPEVDQMNNRLERRGHRANPADRRRPAGRDRPDELDARKYLTFVRGGQHQPPRTFNSGRSRDSHGELGVTGVVP
ncbi:MAG: DUF305 domain-containing protein [Actinobacteria bacterium]|nr:DUF305 domain-containing protein [Actinomycetota bacterium]